MAKGRKKEDKTSLPYSVQKGPIDSGVMSVVLAAVHRDWSGAEGGRRKPGSDSQQQTTQSCRHQNQHLRTPIKARWPSARLKMNSATDKLSTHTFFSTCWLVSPSFPASYQKRANREKPTLILPKKRITLSITSAFRYRLNNNGFCHSLNSTTQWQFVLQRWRQGLSLPKEREREREKREGAQIRGVGVWPSGTLNTNLFFRQ